MTSPLRLSLTPFEIPIAPEQINNPTFCYGLGSDPLKKIDQSLDPATRKAAEFCLLARKNMTPLLEMWNKLSDHTINESNWSSFFTAKNLKNLDKGACACTEILKSTSGKIYDDISLTLHFETNFFNRKKCNNHAFLVIKISDCSFIVDLTIRQYIDELLMISNEDKEMLDSLLTYGFLELTPKTASFYNRFFEGLARKNGVPYLYWCLEKEERPISVEDFLRPSH